MNFACYRLPYSDTYTRIESSKDPIPIFDFRNISTLPGFIVAPFSGPALLIPSDIVNSYKIFQDIDIKKHQDKVIDIDSSISAPCQKVNETPSQEYEIAFKKFHEIVCSGKATKLVLARNKELQTNVNPTAIFNRACICYPRLMIMLFHTEVTGTWIIASPEILLESKGQSSHHTVALAGTMPFSEGYGEWNSKNREEQHIVENYIETKISAICHDIIKDGPVTMRAGHLQHLRTDFRFKGSSIGEIISRLHPTPAVMGFPCDYAKSVIQNNENLDRSYYSGFAGPVAIENDTHLYVSIRCAQLFDNHAVLYAGGGIMPDSDCLLEWIETERKMQTIANLL